MNTRSSRSVGSLGRSAVFILMSFLLLLGCESERAALDRHAERAMALEAEGRLQEALEELELALQKSPGFPQLWFGAGHLQKELGRLEDAERSLQRAIALGPEPIIYELLGEIYGMQQRYDLAAQTYLIAARSGPPPPPGVLYREPEASNYAAAVRHLLLQGEEETAISVLEEALTRNPDSPDLRELADEFTVGVPVNAQPSAPADRATRGG